MTTAPHRLACLTLDLEMNWDFEDPDLKYATFEYLEEYIDLVDSLDIPLSVFVVGQTIEDRPDAIEQLRDQLDVEFHLHSYSHDLSGTAEFEQEVRLGKEAFESFFDRPPEGYRSTQGRIDSSDFAVLESEGFEFDSSIFPTYRPGVYNNLRAPIEPYPAGGNESLLEIPVAVVPKVRFPLSQGYIKAIGSPLLSVLEHVPLHNVVPFNTHLQDLYHTPAHDQLGQQRRAFYGRNMENAEAIFTRFVEILRDKGYSFVKMSDIYERHAN